MVKAFLTGRSQVVKVNGTESNRADVLSGIPQGSVLGPILLKYNPIYICLLMTPRFCVRLHLERMHVSYRKMSIRLNAGPVSGC